MSILEKVQPIETMLPERYYTMSTEDMEKRVREIKEKMGETLFIPGHHYQKDEVVQFSDAAGDSLQLAQVAASNKEAKYIVFC
ncbi:quinolinate synthase NadA, partial [Escherichia coli]|nr:quinolinate synthase NadA [Escherichia coli]